MLVNSNQFTRPILNIEAYVAYHLLLPLIMKIVVAMSEICRLFLSDLIHYHMYQGSMSSLLIADHHSDGRRNKYEFHLLHYHSIPTIKSFCEC